MISNLDKDFFKFCVIETEKQNLHFSKEGIQVNNTIIRWKYSLCILTPLMKGYVRHFDNAKTISSLIGIEDLWLKYKEIWKAIENIFRRRKSVSKSSVKCCALGYLSPPSPQI